MTSVELAVVELRAAIRERLGVLDVSDEDAESCLFRVLGAAADMVGDGTRDETLGES